MPYYSDEDFDQLAKILRVSLGLDDQTKPDAIEFLRRLKRNGYIADYVRVPDSHMPDAGASTIQTTAKFISAKASTPERNIASIVTALRLFTKVPTRS